MSLFVLVPSMVAGRLTLGRLTQITNVFDQKRSSFQYLVMSDEPLPSIDRESLAAG